MTKNATQNDVTKLGELVKDIQFAMMTTTSLDDGTLRSRPMTLQKAEFDGDFWFFTGVSSPVAKDIGVNRQVNLVFSEPKSSAFVSVTGTAEISNDAGKKQELWNPLYKAWFPQGLEDPELRLIRVRVQSADYWDSPSSKVVQLVSFAKAILDGRPPHEGELGERGHIELGSSRAS